MQLNEYDIKNRPQRVAQVIQRMMADIEQLEEEVRKLKDSSQSGDDNDED